MPPNKDAYKLTDDKVEKLGDLGLEAKALRFGGHLVALVYALGGV